MNVRTLMKKIENIEMAEQGKYLGTQVTNDRNLYRKHVEVRVKKRIKMGNYISTIIGGSCNRLLVGKTIWKNIILFVSIALHLVTLSKLNYMILFIFSIDF